MRQTFLISLFLIFLSVSFVQSKNQKIRTWTTVIDNQDKVFKVDGYLKEVSEDGKLAIIVIEGKEKAIPVDIFVHEDKEYIKRFQEAKSGNITTNQFNVGLQAGEKQTFTING